MLEYNMSSKIPLPDDALNVMVMEMLKEVVKRMGVLFQTYKERFDTIVSKSSYKKTKNQQSCKSYVGDNDFLDDFLNLEDFGSIEMDIELTRTNLSYAVVEALICTNDWVRKSKKAIIDNIDDLLNDDDVAQGGSLIGFKP
ncbi:hypothetical protein Tco_1011073 [Tanacetum coccineum]